MSKKVLYLSGPTASGKTELAVSLAQALNGEIVSCDSMQIYRKLQIGTAKPSADEQKGIRHWMLDFVDPAAEYSVSDYVRDAKAVIDEIISRGKTPIVAGGTGYYMSALIHNRDYNSVTNESLSDEIVKEYESEGGPEKLISEICSADPEHASKLNLKDRKRIIRAVELLRTTGSTYSFPPEKYKGEGSDRIFFLNASERSVLYERINSRVDRMVSDGLLSEAEYVYDNRYAFKTAAQAIGYKEFFPYFEDLCSLSECIEDLKISTRHYAKRQITWFRRENIYEIAFDLTTISNITDIICSAYKKDSES